MQLEQYVQKVYSIKCTYKKKRKTQINDLSIYLKNLEREE